MEYQVYNGTGSNYSSDNGSPGPYPGMPPRPPMPVDVLLDFKKYAYVITCAVGILGNILIYIVFTRTKLKKPSTSRYLAAAAVADSGYLLAVMFVKLGEFHKFRFHQLIGPCQIITFGEHAFSFLSRWYLTAVIVEKYIGVMWPRKKSEMCTVFRAKCVIICIAILGIVCYLYVTLFVGVSGNPPQCKLYGDDFSALETWAVLSKFDTIFNFVLPYLIMLILTMPIGFLTWQYHKRSVTTSETFLRRRRGQSNEGKEFKTTPLLILLSCCTLILCTPSSALRLKDFTNPFMGKRPNETDILLMGLFHYFAVLNSAIKIFVYIVASISFARELGTVFCAVRKLWKRSDSNELQTRHVLKEADEHFVISTEGTV
ncbi:hypothetical protein ACF0H5_008571 [Mactra antiquata]